MFWKAYHSAVQWSIFLELCGTGVDLWKQLFEARMAFRGSSIYSLICPVAVVCIINDILLSFCTVNVLFLTFCTHDFAGRVCLKFLSFDRPLNWQLRYSLVEFLINYRKFLRHASMNLQQGPSSFAGLLDVYFGAWPAKLCNLPLFTFLKTFLFVTAFKMFQGETGEVVLWIGSVGNLELATMALHGVCYRCLKYLVLIFNFLFWVRTHSWLGLVHDLIKLCVVSIMYSFEICLILGCNPSSFNQILSDTWTKPWSDPRI